jgi:TRAP-type C4-dicarboxylate transport system permease small subunit
MKKILRLVLDIVEIYLPMLTFVCLFVTFIVQIFFRYVLDDPLMWPEELESLAFIWTTLLSAGYIRRVHGHVAFTLVYERLPEAFRKLSRLCANFLVFLAFIIPLPSIFTYLKALHLEKSSVLRIPLSIGYGPVLVFFLLILGHTLHDIASDLGIIVNKEKI